MKLVRQLVLAVVLSGCGTVGNRDIAPTTLPASVLMSADARFVIEMLNWQCHSLSIVLTN